MIAAPLYTPDQRDVLDRYYTPKRAIAPMLASWGAELQGARVLEPCAGRGDLAWPLSSVAAHVVTNDIAPPIAPPQRDMFSAPTSLDHLGDFLDTYHRAQIAAQHGPFDWCVTNPPYSKIAPIVRACLNVAPRALVIVPWGWLGLYGDRRELMAQVVRVLVVGRVNFLNPYGHAAPSHHRDQSAWVEFGREAREVAAFPVEFYDHKRSKP